MFSEEKCYLVGGAVRDQLLGLPVKDHDYLVVGASVDDMLAAGFTQIGAHFPVFLHPQTKCEYALARTERKTGVGYGGFTVFTSPEVTLEEDLFRRDLTINAIAVDRNGVYCDPCGGMVDLQDKILRHANARTFKEDPVRVLRLARFAARFTDFQVHPETIALAREIVASGELSHVPGERIWKELSKGLMEQRPSRMFEVLRNCNALVKILPELDALWGVPQIASWHPEVDTGVHVMMSIDYAALHNCNLQTRYAVLLHDLGKGLTPKELLPSHHNHESAGLPLVKAVNQRLKVPNDIARLAQVVCTQHLKVHNCEEVRAGTIVSLLTKLNARRDPQMFENALMACLCDARGRLGLSERPYPQIEFLRGCLAAFNAADVVSVSKACVKPHALAQQILNARIHSVNRFIQSRKNAS